MLLSWDDLLFNPGAVQTAVPPNPWTPNLEPVAQRVAMPSILPQQPAAPAIEESPALSPRVTAEMPTFDNSQLYDPFKAFKSAEKAPAPKGALGDSFGVLSPEQQQQWLKDQFAAYETGTQRIKNLEAQMAAQTSPGARRGIDAILRNERAVLPDINKLREIESGFAPLPTKTGARAGVENAARGFSESLLSLPEFAGIVKGYLTPGQVDDDSLLKWSLGAKKSVAELFPGDEARQSDFSQQLANGLGQIATFYGGGAVTSLLKGGPKAMAAVVAAMGASATGSGGFEEATAKLNEAKREALATGHMDTATELDRLLQTMGYAGVGLTEAIPIASTLTRALPNATTTLGSRALAGAEGALEEAIQEGGSTVAQNVIAGQTTDPMRSAGEGALEAAAVGGVLGGGMGAALGGGPREARIPEITPEVEAPIYRGTPGEPISFIDLIPGEGYTEVTPTAQLEAPRKALPTPAAPDAATQEQNSAQELVPIEDLGNGSKRYFVQENGQNVYELDVTEDPKTKSLRVDYVVSLTGQDTNKPSVVRNLLGAIARSYPDYDKISGDRISGSRRVAADAAGRDIGTPADISLSRFRAAAPKKVGVFNNVASVPGLGQVAQVGSGATKTFYLYPEGQDLSGVRPLGVTAREGVAPLARVELRDNGDGRAAVENVEVASSARRQGLATRLYDQLQQQTGLKIQPSGTLSDEGLAFWQNRDPEAVRYYQQFQNINRSPQQMRQAINNPSAHPAWAIEKYKQRLASVPPEAWDAQTFSAAPVAVNAVDAEGQPTARPQFAERRAGMTGKAPPVTPNMALPTKEFRTQIELLLKAGRTVQIPEALVEAVYAAADTVGALIPSTAPVRALTALVPVGQDAKGMPYVEAVFRSEDGSEQRFTYSWKEMQPLAAVYDPAFPGQYFFRLDPAQVGQERLVGQLWHETLHAMRWQGLIPARDFNRLASHAIDLGVLDLTYDVFMELTQHPDAARFKEPDVSGTTIREGYEFLYSDRTPDELEESMLQEAAAHLVELYSHGALTEQQSEPIADILENMANGTYGQRRPQDQAKLNASFGEYVPDEARDSYRAAQGRSTSGQSFAAEDPTAAGLATEQEDGGGTAEAAKPYTANDALNEATGYNAQAEDAVADAMGVALTKGHPVNSTKFNAEFIHQLEYMHDTYQHLTPNTKAQIAGIIYKLLENPATHNDPKPAAPEAEPKPDDKFEFKTIEQVKKAVSGKPALKNSVNNALAKTKEALPIGVKEDTYSFIKQFSGDLWEELDHHTGLSYKNLDKIYAELDKNNKPYKFDNVSELHQFVLEENLGYSTALVFDDAWNIASEKINWGKSTADKEFTIELAKQLKEKAAQISQNPSAKASLAEILSDLADGINVQDGTKFKFNSVADLVNKANELGGYFQQKLQNAWTAAKALVPSSQEETESAKFKSALTQQLAAQAAELEVANEKLSAQMLKALSLGFEESSDPAPAAPVAAKPAESPTYSNLTQVTKALTVAKKDVALDDFTDLWDAATQELALPQFADTKVVRQKVAEKLKDYLEQNGTSGSYGDLKEVLAGLQKNITPLAKGEREAFRVAAPGLTFDDLIPAQDSGNFTFSGKAGGGSKPKEIWKDASGREHMFKPVQKGKEYMAYAEVAGGHIARLVNPHSPRIWFQELNGRSGSMQEMVPNKGTLRDKKLSELSADQIGQLMADHVADWLISNHDNHADQFMIGEDDNIVAIDKGQAFKHFGKDKLSTTYDPNHNVAIGNEAISNILWREFAQGKLRNYTDSIGVGDRIASLQKAVDTLKEEKANLRKRQDELQNKIKTHTAIEDEWIELYSAAGSDKEAKELSILESAYQSIFNEFKDHSYNDEKLTILLSPQVQQLRSDISDIVLADINKIGDKFFNGDEASQQKFKSAVATMGDYLRAKIADPSETSASSAAEKELKALFGDNDDTGLLFNNMYYAVDSILELVDDKLRSEFLYERYWDASKSAKAIRSNLRYNTSIPRLIHSVYRTISPEHKEYEAINNKLYQISFDLRNLEEEADSAETSAQSELVGPVNEAIDILQNKLSDEHYIALLTPYAARRFGDGAAFHGFLDMAVQRKRNLDRKFHKFLLDLAPSRDRVKKSFTGMAGTIGHYERDIAGPMMEKANLKTNLETPEGRREKRDLDREFLALYHYTGSLYQDVNRILRETAPLKDNGLVNHRWVQTVDVARLIEKSLDKLPPYIGEVYRGHSANNDKELTNARPGQIWTTKNFLSTSNNEKSAFGKPTKLTIQSKTGRDITALSSHPDEKEVLFKPDTMFLITDVYRHENKYGDVSYTIYMTELDNLEFDKLPEAIKAGKIIK